MRHSSFHLTHIFAAAACLLMTPRESSAQVFYYGNYNDLGGDSNHLPNFLLGSKYTATQPVTLLSAGVIFRTSGYMSNIGLYTNSGGLPDQLLATTGAFAVTAMGRVETPFTTHPMLAPGDYWFEAVYDLNASLGIQQGTNDLVAYRTLTFTGMLPSSFGTSTTYTGQTFNYYFSGLAVPEPSALALVGLASCIMAARRAWRKRAA